MFNELQTVLSVYLKRPVFFIFNSLHYVFFMLLITLALIGVLFVAFFTSSMVNMSATSLPMLFVYAAVLVAFFYFSAAFHGALINSYSKSLEGQQTKLLEFYHYALDNGFKFFWIFVLKMFVELVFLALPIILYLFVLKTFTQYIDYIMIVVTLFIMFIANFSFYGASAAAATLNMNARQSIITNLHFIRKRHIFVLISFLILVVVWLTLFIPLVQLFTLFVTYPIVLSAFCLYLRNNYQKQETPVAKAPEKPIEKQTKEQKPEKSKK